MSSSKSNSHVCPCCHQPVSGKPKLIEYVRGLKVGPVAKSVLLSIVKRQWEGQPVSVSQIIEDVYGSNADAPEMANRSVHVMISRNRQVIRDAGLDLITRMGRGGGYLIRWADEKSAAA